MIEQIEGEVLEISEKFLVINSQGLGLKVFVPKPEQFELGKKEKIKTFFNWNQEKGPSIFGFKTNSEKETFSLLIECPKVGPQIALQVLRQLDPQTVLKALSTQDSSLLSKVNGIGQKVAKNLINALEEKATNLLSSKDFSSEEENFDKVFYQVRQALDSLGYKPCQISQAIEFSISDLKSESEKSFDQVLRAALGYFNQ